MKKTVVELDLVGYSTICDNLEQGLDVDTVARLDQQIQSFIDTGLEAIRAPREQTVMRNTGDGAILVFDSAKDAHRFAQTVHEATREHNRTRTQPLAKRVFRMGAATGDIVMQPRSSAGFEIAGMAIARAVRLEDKAQPGGLLVDAATFAELLPEQQQAYGDRQIVAGKRDEAFEAYPCQPNPDGFKDVTFFTEQAEKAGHLPPLPSPEPHARSGEIGALALSSGTITFLMTEIEGGAGLWEQQPEAIQATMARWDALMTRCVQEHGGIVITETSDNDRIGAIFARADWALVAACALQRAMVRETWPAAASLRVRAALHSGEPGRRGGYRGAALSRCVRLRDIAHGGQTLLSETTADLVRDALPEGAGLQDIGVHRLRDLAHPEHVYQLLHPDLPGEFPPLNSLDAAPNNLPLQLTRFIGRERELAEVKRLLGSTRLLTLTGSGGCGKTRLTLQVAADLLEAYPEGVWLVELAALTDPDLVPPTLASLLQLQGEPGRSLVSTLVDYLKPRTALLLLDNCEHLLDGCARLADALLRACPNLRILASSREGMGIAGEQIYRVPSLTLPEPDWPPTAGDLERCEAARLFVDRALLSRPDFVLTDGNAPAVALVCQRLDGIPLAIELAAPRVKVLTVEQIAARLDDRFRLLTEGSRTALPRQQTLRAAVDWSYDLLTEPERLLLRRLSVFAGGWTLEAAESVCGTSAASGDIEGWGVLELLSHLVDKSLVVTEEQAARYRLLETIRRYGRDRLAETGEAEALSARHLEYFLALAEQMAPLAHTPDCLDHLKADRDNLVAALQWASRSGHNVPCARLALMLYPLAHRRGYWREARQCLGIGAAAAERLEGNEGKRLLAAIRHYQACLAHDTGDLIAARDQAEAGLVLRRALGDRPGIAESLNLLGILSMEEGRADEALRFYEESLLLLAPDDHYGRGKALHNLAHLAARRGDGAEAKRLYQDALIHRQAADDQGGEAETRNNLGTLAHNKGELAEARRQYRESLALYQALRDAHGIAVMLNNLGELAEAEGDAPTALALFVHAERMLRDLNSGAAHVPADALERLAAAVGAERFVDLRARAERTSWNDVVRQATLARHSL